MRVVKGGRRVVGLALAGAGVAVGLQACGIAQRPTAGTGSRPASRASVTTPVAGGDPAPWRREVLAAALQRAAEPAPAPVPTAAATVSPPSSPPARLSTPRIAARPAAVTPAPPPGPRHDWVEAPSIGLSVPVSIYSDCTGATVLTRSSAARDTCVPAAEVFLVGHRPGPFGNLPSVSIGAKVTYWDPAGAARTYTIYQASRVPKSDGGPVMETQHPPLLMQTCDDATGSYWYFYGS